MGEGPERRRDAPEASVLLGGQWRSQMIRTARGSADGLPPEGGGDRRPHDVSKPEAMVLLTEVKRTEAHVKS